MIEGIPYYLKSSVAYLANMMRNLYNQAILVSKKDWVGWNASGAIKNIEYIVGRITMPLERTKYYRVINDDNLAKGNSYLDKELFSKTGFYSEDYIYPVTQGGGEIIDVVVDESVFKEHYSVGLVLLARECKKTDIEKQLERLVNKYRLKNIHFSDILGQKKILGRQRYDFLSEFELIVGPIPMSCISISKNINHIKEAWGGEDPTREEIFHSLLWSCFDNLVSVSPEHSIFHVHTEKEYSMDGDLRSIGMKYFQKLYSGIDHVSEKQNKKFSICKHPHFFSKEALFFSSISDLLAYGGNKLQNKIDMGIPDKKIVREHRVLLHLLKMTFNNYSGMPSPKLANLIDSV